MRHGADTVEKEHVSDRYREDDNERPCDHCDFQEIESRQAAAVMEAVKKERERVLDLVLEWLHKYYIPTVIKNMKELRDES